MENKIELKISKIDPYNCSLEELEIEIKRLNSLKDEYDGMQNGIKVFINSIYGAMASPWFECYNISVAEAVTLQGQDIAKYASNVLDNYFINEWHNDKKLHEALGISYANKISEETLTIYMDTDSCHKDSFVTTTSGIKTIEEWYNENENPAGNTIAGHESVLTEDKILNWGDKHNLYFAPVKRIIRHKVTKSKWKLKTKSGKELLVTNDHSLIVFRNNCKLEIKPKDILNGDKVLCIK
jgi:hypothetical protein